MVYGKQIKMAQDIWCINWRNNMKDNIGWYITFAILIGIWIVVIQQ